MIAILRGGGGEAPDINRFRSVDGWIPDHHDRLIFPQGARAIRPAPGFSAIRDLPQYRICMNHASMIELLA